MNTIELAEDENPMQAPQIPADESDRLASLRKMGLLDTPPEDRFDRLTRLAAQLFKVPIALVSLVDADRQWFKSRHGLNACETGRDISFCGHAILGNEIFEVPDARFDSRFADNPLVVGPPDIRFYAGAPLAAPDGSNIGTLCLIDSRPRQLTGQERVNLREIADIVMDEIAREALLEQGLALARERHLSDIIARSQSEFILAPDQRTAFDRMLIDLLALTDSEYGFVGEVLHTPDGKPYLKTYAITNIAWDDATRHFYDTHIPTGMEFVNLGTLFGAVLSSGKTMIANEPSAHPSRGGLPHGHPPLNAFLGVPVLYGDRMVAMAGLANRPGGYDQALVDFLQPLLITLGQLVDAAQSRKRHAAVQAELDRLSLVARKTSNAIAITDAQGNIEWANTNFTVLTGLRPDELTGVAVETVLSMHVETPEDVAALSQALQQTGSVKTELAFTPAPGQREWLRMTVDSMADDGGICTGYVIALEVITREKLDAEKLQESERQFRTLVNNIPGITYRCLMDEHWTMIFMSDQVDPLSGYPASDFIHNAVRSYQSVIHPDDRGMADQTVAAAVQCNEAWSVEYRILHRDGSIRWAHERGSAVQDDSGRIQCLDGFILDITEEKRLRIESQRQIDAFAVLNEISSNATLSIPEQTYRALELGARFLGMDLGILGRIEGDYYRIRARMVVSGAAPRRDQIFCRRRYRMQAR